MKKKVFLLIISIFCREIYADRDEFLYYNKFNPYASVYNSLSALDNPAIFGYLQDNQFTFFYQESFSNESKFYGSVVEIKNFGLGINYIDSNFVDFLKYSVPFGFRVGDYMVMGVGFSIFDPIEPKYDLSFDWYAGTYFMPARFLNISVVGQNLGQPSVGDIKLPRRLNLGLGIKPFSDLFELYGDFSFIEHNKDIPNRYFVAINPVKGLRLYYGINEEKDMYGGINLDLAKFGFSFLGSYSDKDRDFDGKGIAFRYSKNSYEELFALSQEVILIRLDNTVIDGVREDMFGLRKKSRSVLDIINIIRSAANDSVVSGLILYVSDIDISLGAAGDIRRALSEFKSRGKTVVAFLESGDDKTYYIANIADKIILNEGGSIYLKGAASIGLYFRNLFEKIGLRFDVVAAGEYKTAFEPLVLEKASNKRKEQTQRLLSSIQKILDDAIIKSRGIEDKKLEQIYSNALFSPRRAKEERLVDDVSVFERILSDTKYYFGKPYPVNENYTETGIFRGGWHIKRRIAVIYLNGDIVYGKGFGDTVGLESIGNVDISDIVGEIMKDESIVGVIVRINSPGGSTLASQLIYEDIRRLSSVKPLVVSVGSMAASGGYFSAIASDYIIADELSIVGSIGVFFLKPDISGLLKKLGVNYEPYVVKQSGDSDSIFRGLSDSEIKGIKNFIDEFYEFFRSKVSLSRDIDISKVSELSEGRVFTGAEAKLLGLVDGVGGYVLAEQKIRSLANIPYDVGIEFVEYSKKGGLSEVMLDQESILDRVLNYIVKEKRITDFVLYRYFNEN
ncbi:MAG: signal peptide peptidase SppA [Deltaproteobacteria bacterium]|nr:signal peptide peptidase SppA [Deltaproteobacteria bacterium]